MQNDTERITHLQNEVDKINQDIKEIIEARNKVKNKHTQWKLQQVIKDMSEDIQKINSRIMEIKYKEEL